MSKSQPSHETRKQPIFAEFCDFAEGRNPLHVFLADFTDDSARTMRAALDSVADILTDGRIKAEDLAWHRLRSNHVTALGGRMLRSWPSSATRGSAAPSWRHSASATSPGRTPRCGSWAKATSSGPSSCRPASPSLASASQPPCAIRGQHERRHRRGVLQCRAHDFGRVDDAHLHHVALLVGLGVVARCSLSPFSPISNG